MKDIDIFRILEIFFAFLTTFATILAVIYAIKIGNKQNEINAQALGLQDFAEIFLSPNQFIQEDINTKKKIVEWNLKVKNASSIPIYLDKITFNQLEQNIGGTSLPTNSDDGFIYLIPKGINDFNVSVDFEDYQGRKYRTNGKGTLINGMWYVNSTRRKRL